MVKWVYIAQKYLYCFLCIIHILYGSLYSAITIPVTPSPYTCMMCPVMQTRKLQKFGQVSVILLPNMYCRQRNLVSVYNSFFKVRVLKLVSSGEKSIFL